MFLSQEEVTDLTGYSRPSAQVKWLKDQGFGCVVGGDGMPKVLREVVLSRLSGSGIKQKKEPRLRLTG